MAYYILTGAGFSRNWGGSLSREVWEFLLGHKDVQNNKNLKTLLLDKGSHGFEDALGELKQYVRQDHNYLKDYITLQNVVLEAFEEMDKLFAQPYSDFRAVNTFEKFLSKFDVFFTTNQDMLVERQFGNFTQGLSSSQNRSCVIPGIKWQEPYAFRGAYYQGTHLTSRFDNRIQHPSESNRSLDSNTIPYIKLHGSFNWRTSPALHNELMIVGSQKEEQIKENPLIKWYFDIFREKLFSPGSRLLVLGHSLLDPHINKNIFEAVETENLKFYIWNPSGLEGVIKNLTSINQYERDLFNKGVIGVSTRSLQEMLRDESLMESELYRIQREFFAN